MNETESDKKNSSATKITLPSGEVIELGHWVFGSLRAACVVMPYGESAKEQLDLYSSGRSQQLQGAPAGEKATHVHTNIPRSGDNGLPKEWEMIVQGWRAQCSLALEQEVIDFASSCVVQFHYNRTNYRDANLAELLLGESNLSTMNGHQGLPIRMKEMLSYGVAITPQSAKEVEKFQAYLRSKAPSNVDPTVIAELDQLARMAGGNVGTEIARIQTKLQPGVRATFWVNLDGIIKRVVA